MSGAGVEQEGQAGALGVGQRRPGVDDGLDVLGEALDGEHGAELGYARVVGAAMSLDRGDGRG